MCSTLKTMTQIFDVVSIISYVLRNGLHGYQCNCSHMTTEKARRCRGVRTDPKESRRLDPKLYSHCKSHFVAEHLMQILLILCICKKH